MVISSEWQYCTAWCCSSVEFSPCLANVVNAMKSHLSFNQEICILELIVWSSLYSLGICFWVSNPFLIQRFTSDLYFKKGLFAAAASSPAMPPFGPRWSAMLFHALLTSRLGYCNVPLKTNLKLRLVQNAAGVAFRTSITPLFKCLLVWFWAQFKCPILAFIALHDFDCRYLRDCLLSLQTSVV